MPNEKATWEDFLEVTRQLESKMNARPRPVVEEPTEEPVSIDTTPPPDPGLHIDPSDNPDVGFGYPEPDDDYEEPGPRYIPKPELFPGQNLNPDLNIIADDPDSFVTISGDRFRLVMGPRDEDDLDMELANSYGG